MANQSRVKAVSAAAQARQKSQKRADQFQVGNVRGYLRGRVWYLYYHEQGQRRRPRVGPDRVIARQMAAQINSQLEVGAPSSLSFEPIAFVELRDRWLHRHEHVLRSSVQTIRRYRTATEHLIRYAQMVRPVKVVSNFTVSHAEDFVRHLRSIRVSPNGHPNSAKRPLLDKGIQYILETCRTLFAYAIKRRHLSPYAENPFSALELGRLPIEHFRKIVLPTADQQIALLKACDNWQLPIYVTLMLTGLRPGELGHLLLPEDIDFEQNLLFVRNRINLGWQIKTRNERTIPLVPCLARLLKAHMGTRAQGPVFLRRQFATEYSPSWSSISLAEKELNRRVQQLEEAAKEPCSSAVKATLARRLWVEWGLVDADRIRTDFIRLTKQIGAPTITAPKTLRHLFATTLQDANVDPMIRNELMGHSTTDTCRNGLGMTGTYTHTRLETKRSQLESAFVQSPIATIVTQQLNQM